MTSVLPEQKSLGVWRDFWNKSHRIYVNDRHKAVHYRQVADDILSVLPQGTGEVVLDYGCGEALEAGRVAARAERLFLFDTAHDVRERLARRFAGDKRVSILDEAALAAMPDGTVDLMIVNSVVQYLDRAELDTLLACAKRLLRPGGRLVIADVIPPDAGMVADVGSLLRTALRHGFLGAAAAGLAATFFSDYRRLRRSVGLATYTEEAMCGILGDAGFAAELRQRNFGFNPQRMTFLARRPG